MRYCSAHGQPGVLGKANEGVAAWNQWRALSRGNIDLTKADLRERDLTGVDFGVERQIAEPTGSSVIERRLSIVDLRGADLSHSKLTRARLNERSRIGPEPNPNSQSVL